ncbi:GNAT family N-acetyltransferase [Lentzea sp. NPDC051838]|uniref:GNAT family N-acetyltransferase n=1 Tax=Lentzea sp. NPDC051838 TaxID=3154849 RepID=UPI0034240DF8
MLRPDYPIRTERLTLRPFDANDFEAFYAYRSLPDVHRYLNNKAADREGVAQLLARRTTEHQLAEAGQRLALAVCLDDKVIGDVALVWRTDHEGEIGYSLHPTFQGKGYAREAAEAMLRIGFDELKLRRIVAECDPRNEPSRRVMERLGMRKGTSGDGLVYAMLAEEFKNKR